MNKFFNYFNNSYGFDKFSKYMLILGLIFSLTKFTEIAGILLAIYALWRSLSKNKFERYKELQKFETLLIVGKQEIYRLKMKINNFKQYKVFKCPKCSQKLRVPRKKGKLTITCKKCNTEFKGRT